MEKARALAKSGQEVAFLLCYDKQITKRSIDIREEDHFLYQTLKEKLSNKKVRLQLIDVWKVMERVNQLIEEKIHIMVDEYSFAYNKLDLQAKKKVNSFSATLNLPNVKAQQDLLHERLFFQTLLLTGFAHLCLVCW